MLSPDLIDPALDLEADLEEGCMANDEDKAGERGELHFLAALCDELMRALLITGVLSRAQLNEIEAAVARRVDNPPRGW